MDNGNFDIGTDGSYSEIFQYVEWLAVVILFALLACLRKSATYLSWMGLVIYLLLDDALKIHETLGSYIAQYLYFSPPLGLRLKDIGEVAVSVIAGVILITIVLITYRRGSKPFVKVSHDMLLFLSGLIFFGIFLDLAHFVVKLGRYVTIFLEVAEDGGEMIMTSLMLWYAAFLTQGKERPEMSLCRCIWSGMQTPETELPGQTKPSTHRLK